MTIPVRFYPGIIEFLGYNPLPEAKTPGEAVRRARMSLGLGRLDLARRAGMTEGTIRKIEYDAPGMLRRSKRRVYKALGLDLEP
jgi:ribosome-binding protein aMBF1 (putative translation factor)